MAARAARAGDAVFRAQSRAADAIPIAYWDERLSTAAVTRTLIAADASRARRAEVVDKMAAAFILQGAIDMLGREARQAALDAELGLSGLRESNSPHTPSCRA